MSTGATPGLWARQSTTTKAVVIVGTILLVGGIITYAAWPKKTEEEIAAKKKAEEDAAAKAKADALAATTKTPDGLSSTPASSGTTTIVPPASSTTTTTPPATTTTTPPASTSTNSTLPGAGEQCGIIREDFDRDFNYVRCKNVWYTISKPNPATDKYKGYYTTWHSLADNTTATPRLNVRYPNG